MTDFEARKAALLTEYKEALRDGNVKRGRESREQNALLIRATQRIDEQNKEVLNIIHQIHENDLRKVRSLQEEIAKCRVEALIYKDDFLKISKDNRASDKKAAGLSMLKIDSEHIRRKLENLKFMTSPSLSNSTSSLKPVIQTVIQNLTPKINTFLLDLQLLKTNTLALEGWVQKVYDNLEEFNLESVLVDKPTFNEEILTTWNTVIKHLIV